MFLKITRSGPRQYLQLVESFRDEAGKAKPRTLANLGRLDRMAGSLDAVIAGLPKVTGRSPDIRISRRRRPSNSSRPVPWVMCGR